MEVTVLGDSLLSSLVLSNLQYKWPPRINQPVQGSTSYLKYLPRCKAPRSIVPARLLNFVKRVTSAYQVDMSLSVWPSSLVLVPFFLSPPELYTSRSLLARELC